MWCCENIIFSCSPFVDWNHLNCESIRCCIIYWLLSRDKIFTKRFLCYLSPNSIIAINLAVKPKSTGVFSFVDISIYLHILQLSEIIARYGKCTVQCTRRSK